MRILYYFLAITLGIQSVVYAASAEEGVDKNSIAINAHIASIKSAIFRYNKTGDLLGIKQAFSDYITLARTVAPQDDVLLPIAGLGEIRSGHLADGLKLLEEFIEMRKNGPYLDKDSASILAETATAYLRLDNETNTIDNHRRAMELFVEYFNLIGSPQDVPPKLYGALPMTGALYKLFGDNEKALKFYEHYFGLINGIRNTEIKHAYVLKDFGDLLCLAKRNGEAAETYHQYFITTNTLRAPAPEDMYMNNLIKIVCMQQASQTWLARHSGKKIDLFRRQIRSRQPSPLVPRSTPKPSQALVPSEDSHDVENAGGHGGTC